MLLLRLFAPLFLCLALFGQAHAATDGAAVVAEISRRGDAAVATYDSANPLATATEFSSLYFDVFEGAGMELDLGIRGPGIKSELEILFGAVNGKAMRGVPATELAASWNLLRSKLDQAGALYGQSESDGFVPVMLKSTLILLREGVEAMLIIGALAAYMRRAGAADRIWVLHSGVAIAIPLSLLTGWALTGVLQAAGASRPVIEGCTMLLAAGVLFYVGFWLFSRREAQRWQAWIAGQVDSALSQGSALALGAAACLAVYREGAETVLFYHALFVGSPEQGGAIAAGIGAAAALLVVLYVALDYFSIRLPYKPFFTATAILVYGLGVVFLGQGLIELQASGSLPATPLDNWPQIAWLGISPTMQGMLAQGLFLLLPVIVWLPRRRAGVPG